MEIMLTALGGFGLFLFAINNLSETLKDILGDNAKKWLSYFTKNLITAVLTGIVITTILDSSSAVIIMTIVLVNAIALTFPQSLGVVMGANIGTTFSSQLIALDIGQFSSIPIFSELIVDNSSRYCQAIRVGKSIKGIDVVEVMEALKRENNLVPKRIQVDNGREFIS